MRRQKLAESMRTGAPLPGGRWRFLWFPCAVGLLIGFLLGGIVDLPSWLWWIALGVAIASFAHQHRESRRS